MAHHKHNPVDTPDIKVFIRNLGGEYLAGAADKAYFTDNRAEALVVNYRTDRVPEQIALIRKSQGIFLVADPVPLDEIYERCDRCGELASPLMVVFDGAKFICADCHKPRKRPARFPRKPAA
jgi:hypothetical protein